MEKECVYIHRRVFFHIKEPFWPLQLTNYTSSCDAIVFEKMDYEKPVGMLLYSYTDALETFMESI